MPPEPVDPLNSALDTLRNAVNRAPKTAVALAISRWLESASERAHLQGVRQGYAGAVRYELDPDLVTQLAINLWKAGDELTMSSASRMNWRRFGNEEIETAMLNVLNGWHEQLMRQHGDSEVTSWSDAQLNALNIALIPALYFRLYRRYDTKSFSLARVLRHEPRVHIFHPRDIRDVERLVMAIDRAVTDDRSLTGAHRACLHYVVNTVSESLEADSTGVPALVLAQVILAGGSQDIESRRFWEDRAFSILAEHEVPQRFAGAIFGRLLDSVRIEFDDAADRPRSSRSNESRIARFAQAVAVRDPSALLAIADDPAISLSPSFRSVLRLGALTAVAGTVAPDARESRLPSEIVSALASIGGPTSGASRNSELIRAIWDGAVSRGQRANNDTHNRMIEGRITFRSLFALHQDSHRWLGPGPVAIAQLSKLLMTSDQDGRLLVQVMEAQIQGSAQRNDPVDVLRTINEFVDNQSRRPMAGTLSPDAVRMVIGLFDGNGYFDADTARNLLVALCLDLAICTSGDVGQLAGFLYRHATTRDAPYSEAELDLILQMARTNGGPDSYDLFGVAALAALTRGFDRVARDLLQVRPGEMSVAEYLTTFRSEIDSNPDDSVGRAFANTTPIRGTGETARDRLLAMAVQEIARGPVASRSNVITQVEQLIAAAAALTSGVSMEEHYRAVDTIASTLSLLDMDGLALLRTYDEASRRLLAGILKVRLINSRVFASRSALEAEISFGLGDSQSVVDADNDVLGAFRRATAELQAFIATDGTGVVDCTDENTRVDRHIGVGLTENDDEQTESEMQSPAHWLGQSIERIDAFLGRADGLIETDPNWSDAVITALIERSRSSTSDFERNRFLREAVSVLCSVTALPLPGLNTIASDAAPVVTAYQDRTANALFDALEPTGEIDLRITTALAGMMSDPTLLARAADQIDLSVRARSLMVLCGVAALSDFSDGGSTVVERTLFSSVASSIASAPGSDVDTTFSELVVSVLARTRDTSAIRSSRLQSAIVEGLLERSLESLYQHVDA